MWIKKKRYNGADLAPDGFAWIGQMIDYARGLNFHQLPKYDLLHSLIREADRQACVFDSPDIQIEWDISIRFVHYCTIIRDFYLTRSYSTDDPSPHNVPNDLTFSLSPRQIVSCQAGVRTTLEGCTTRAGDRSFWDDLSLSSETWIQRSAQQLFSASR
jgi:hypothetical protein